MFQSSCLSHTAALFADLNCETLTRMVLIGYVKVGMLLLEYNIHE